MGKVKKYIEDIFFNLKNDCHFSVKLALCGIIGKTWGRIIPKVLEMCSHYRTVFVSQYLDDLLQEVLEKNKNYETAGEFVETAPIWVCWWTGIETAPQIVQQCVESIQRAAGKHPVYLIAQNNYKEFIHIPNYILEKVENGSMCIANFSDYLRVSLLEKYGGLWLDATIYIPQTIPEDIFDKSLYTCKSPDAKGYLANGRWTSYCLGGWKNHQFFKMARECFELYWAREEISIDYLLVDYVFSFIYENHIYIKECIDNIPINNMQRNDLAGAMIRGDKSEVFSKIITEETSFYKLSWREKYPLFTTSGEESIYSYFLTLRR